MRLEATPRYSPSHATRFHHFSGTTYTTLGTGKHVLVPPNRVLEPVEATNGMLAAGLNTALLFAILSSMARKHADYDDFFR